MNFTITLTATPEFLNVLGMIATALTGQKVNNDVPVDEPKLSTTEQETPQSKPIEVDTTRTIEPQGVEQESATTQVQESTNQAGTRTITPEELRAVAATKDRAKVKSLLEDWDFKSISAIPESDREQFMKTLRGI